MGTISWDARKDVVLRKERKVSFDEMATAIGEGRVLEFLEHHNQKSYPGQCLFVVEVREYAYLVAVSFDGDNIEFKTVIPSRKATRDYLRGGGRRG